MIKKLPLLSFLSFLFFNVSFSQDRYEDSIKGIIEKDFAQIKPEDLINLVPYETRKGAGYLNSKNNKTVLKPKYHQLDFAKPNLKGNYDNTSYFEIDSKTKEVKVFIQNWQIFDDSSVWHEPISKGYSRGFYVVNNSIFSYSGTYSYCPYLFKYKNEYFAIAVKDQKKAVINADGETRTNLNFEYAALDMINLGNDIIWFKYKTTAGEEGFINMDGEKKLVNDIISSSRSKTEGHFSFIDTEHSLKINYYGYSVESNDELSGVLDLLTMQWVIRPQKALKIEEINYASNSEVEEKYNLEDRAGLKFYFLVRDEKKQTSYYIDDKLRRYLPK
ncbi:hypothetical protein L1276_005090 [Flavobacterium sp. HSC-32F16]|uniref:hypothetical protein n=1 Tax=Flavobacterium sp. HSC-32F16 TaxID=2910964 RepID=UPI0020A39CF8|nr:hypothetical protein [Flavobacterium sp. HSC-32F16]MCP2029896.1 hypothetical protein [Flavobacterium sp. HSC-32F16]